MTEHKMLGTEGYGQFGQPSVALIESRRFEQVARATSFDAATGEIIERRVAASSTDSHGQLPASLKALE